MTEDTEFDCLSKTGHQQAVELFMVKAGQAVPATPTIPDQSTRRLRAQIILEECLETIQALGFLIDCEIEQKPDGEKYHNWTIFDGKEPTSLEDLAEIMDGCADIRVVTTETQIACGVIANPIQKLVDDSNLAKFGPGGYKSDGSDGNPIGKWCKPKGWKKPDLPAELIRQGWPVKKSAK